MCPRWAPGDRFREAPMARQCGTQTKTFPAPGCRGTHTSTHVKLLTVLTIGLHMIPGIGVHAMDDRRSPFLDPIGPSLAHVRRHSDKLWSGAKHIHFYYNFWNVRTLQFNGNGLTYIAIDENDQLNVGLDQWNIYDAMDESKNVSLVLLVFNKPRRFLYHITTLVRLTLCIT